MAQANQKEKLGAADGDEVEEIAGHFVAPRNSSGVQSSVTQVRKLAQRVSDLEVALAAFTLRVEALERK